MIGKSDIFIITLASSMLLVAVARSTIYTPSSPMSAGYTRPVPQMQPVATGTTAANRPASVTAQLDNNPDGNTSKGVVVVTSANEFKQPDIIQEASFHTHIVKSGDVLSRIAVRYKTTVAELQSLNGINGTVIHVGQTLVYPSSP